MHTNEIYRVAVGAVEKNVAGKWVGHDLQGEPL